MSGKDINKAESTPSSVTRPLSIERGQPQIITSSKYIQDQRNRDLRMPQRFCTYDKMAENDSVFNSIDITNLLVLTAMQGGSFVAKANSNQSKVAADFLNYCIRNMEYGTWLESMNNACTDLQYGFSLQNIVLTKAKHGQYKGANVIKKLAPRDQKSLYGWVWDKNLRDLRGFVQKPLKRQMSDVTRRQYESGITMNGLSSLPRGYSFLERDQFLHFRHNPTNNDPQGDSPLNHCYAAWQELMLVSRYEIIGTSKDLSGSVVLRVPSELIERANNPEEYPDEALEYEQLQIDAGNLHAGESSYIVLSSDVDEYSKQPLYDFELKGIQGGGKQTDTSAIIDQKRKSIYNCFGTGFLLLGQSGSGGSNALSSNQMSTHDQYVNRNVLWKCDVLNNQLAPRLLAANNIYLNYKDMPEFVPADPTKPDLDTLSKVLQRAGSVEMLTPSAIEDIYNQAGWSTEGLDQFLTERKESKIESRAGESQGTSGTGDTQSEGSNSATNTENKSLVVDYETETEIVAVDTKTGEPTFISKEE